MEKTIEWYFDKINKYKVLSKEEEQQLFKTMFHSNKQEPEYWEARQEIILHNLKLVPFVIEKKFTLAKRTTDSYLEYMQEGIIGLEKAVEKYDVFKNAKFSTYAQYWIYNTIYRHMEEMQVGVRYPIYFLEAKYQIEVFEELFESLNQRLPTAEETFSYFKGKYSSRLIKQVHEVPEYVYLEHRALENFEDKKQDRFVDSETRKILKKALNTLSERQKSVIIKRYGLNGDEEETYQKIGEELSISVERARQIEARALRKLGFASENSNEMRQLYYND